MVDVVGGIYDAGKVSVVNGSKSVTGTGTFWLAIGEMLDEIWIGDRNALVAQFNSDVELELALPWSGETLTDVDYVLNLRSPLRYDPAITQAKVRDLIAFYTLGGVRGTRTVVNATDAITVDDREKVIKYNRATAIAVTLPAAGANGQFVDGWAAWLKNSGAGAVSITSTSLIDGSSDPYVIPERAAVRLWVNDQGGYDVIFYSDGGGIAIGAAGELSGRSAFDSEDPGFTYFATDTDLLYIRLNTGGWSDGSSLNGTKGDQGDAGTIEVGTVTTLDPGEEPTVTNVGTSSAAILDFGIPKGEKGDPNTLDIGMVTEGDTADASITGDAPNQHLNLVLPRGPGGDAATVEVGTVTTLSAGSPATVTNSGTDTAAVLDFGIPQGASGAGTGDMLAANNLSELTDDAAARSNLGLGSAATSAASDFATAAQGAKADTALQPREPIVVTANGSIAAKIGAVAVQKISPTATSLSLPSVTNQAGIPLSIIDWSSSVTDHAITLTPDGSETIMNVSSWSIYSNSSQLASITLYPSTTLNGWFIAP